MTRSELLIQFALRLQNQSILDSTDFIQLLAESLIDFNVYRPQQTVEDIIGNDTQSISLPATWETDFSKIIQIELIDIVDGEEVSDIFTSDMYELYESPTETSIRFTEDTDSNYTYRIRFTIQHTISETVCTLSDTDAYAILNHATANGCLILSSVAISNLDQEMGSAIIEGRRGGKSPAEEYQALAKFYDTRWRKTMNLPLDDTKTQPIIAATSLEWRGEGHGKLFHRFF